VTLPTTITPAAAVVALCMNSLRLRMRFVIHFLPG
jgi:hypothetical protein